MSTPPDGSRIKDQGGALSASVRLAHGAGSRARDGSPSHTCHTHVTWWAECVSYSLRNIETNGTATGAGGVARSGALWCL